MHRDVIAIPEHLAPHEGERLTGVTCPDCPGVLTVRVEGRSYFVFTCRIGHAYSLDELLELKEKRLEEGLWGTVTAAEELRALLTDSKLHNERRDALDRLAQALRDLLDTNEPVAMGDGPVTTDVSLGSRAR